jgi:hypothetical protein
MKTTNDYTVNSDGFVAGRWRAKDSTVTLSPAAAKYENVTAKTKSAPKPKSGNKPKRRASDDNATDKASTEAPVADTDAGEPGAGSEA